jgi:hypothetical protein
MSFIAVHNQATPSAEWAERVFGGNVIPHNSLWCYATTERSIS